MIRFPTRGPACHTGFRRLPSGKCQIGCLQLKNVGGKEFRGFLEFLLCPPPRVELKDWKPPALKT